MVALVEKAKGEIDAAEAERMAKKLAKGQFTETPVKTQFGFHIIRLENVRPMKMPPVAEVRGQIMQSLQQQKFEELKAELRKGAKISE